MSHWLLDGIEDRRRAALEASEKAWVDNVLRSKDDEMDRDLIRTMANALELASLDLILERFEENEGNENMLRAAARDAFQLFKTLYPAGSPLEQGTMLLRASCLAILAARGSEATRWLRDLEDTGDWPDLPIHSENWGERTWAILLDIWLCLIRNRGRTDCELVINRIADLRNSQMEFEKKYLDGVPAQSAKATALELIGLYHLIKAAETLSHFVIEGVVEGGYKVQQLLDVHFDKVQAVCESARLIELEPMFRLLEAATTKFVDEKISTAN